MASIRKEFRKNTQFSANIFVDNVSVVSLDASFSLDDPQVPVINRYISDCALSFPCTYNNVPTFPFLLIP